MTRAIIIGSGIAGLAVAIRLARQGISVQVYESTGTVGGKISERKFGGFRFDAGPSLLTLPELVLELLDDDLQFPIKKLELITKYFYPDGTQLSAYSDIQKFSQEISTKLNVPAERLSNYLQHAANVFNLTARLFIFGSFHRIKNLINRHAWETILKFRQLHAFRTLHDFNHQEIREKRLVQLFDRYATYNGSNPYQTPATLSVISHLEHNLGAFIPEEGMFQITESLYKQALRLGVKFNFNEPVRKVVTKKKKVKGVQTDSGVTASEIIVSDVDILGFYSELLPDTKRRIKIEKEERSSSALIFYWGMKGNYEELDVHNIFFSKDYREEFRHLFYKKDIYFDPTIYIYISKRYNENDAPEGTENWFVMVNAPADTGQNWDEIIKLLRIYILEKLEKMMGRKLEGCILCEEVLSPPDIFKQTGSVNGSLYGSSSNSRFASFNRHANFRKDIRGLYFVGGSVHPGGGIPLCLSSARIVEGLVKEQLKF